MLVVGAGIGGLLFLKMIRDLPVGGDWSIEVVERTVAFAPLGVGIVIHPNGMAVLADRALDVECRGCGIELKRIELTRGQNRLDLPLQAVWDGVTHPSIAITRSDLHAILVHAVLGDAPETIKLIMGRTVVSVDPKETQCVVHFDDGSQKAYDLVVGADGVHSTVRRSVAKGADAVSTGLVYFRFLAENTIGQDEDLWAITEEADSSWGFIPVRKGLLHCFVQIRAPAALELCAEEYLRQHFKRRDPRIVRCLNVATGPVQMHVAFMVRPIQWGIGTCVLLGDAAHAVSPTLSEGGSLAMEDAVVLASALAACDSIPDAIAHYRSGRLDRVVWAHRMSLAQVNSLRRPFIDRNVDSVIATRHMRQMYEPFRRSVSYGLVNCVGRLGLPNHQR